MWDHNDYDGQLDQENYEIEVGTDADWGNGAEIWASGVLNGTTDNYLKRLSSLDNGQTYYYRIRTTDESGIWSNWANPSFSLGIKLNAIVASHSDGEVVVLGESQTFTPDWDYSGEETIIVENWEIENQGTFTEDSPSVTFDTTGEYDVTLNIRENNSVSDSTTITLSVEEEGTVVGGGGTDDGEVTPTKEETSWYEGNYEIGSFLGMFTVYAWMVALILLVIGLGTENYRLLFVSLVALVLSWGGWI
jgi:hypothetical protein